MHYPQVSLYALMLAAAGIPLYIHLPQFAAVELGMGLGALGVVLLVIRLVDLVQDPLIGWAIDRWPRAQGVFAIAAALGLAIGFPALFTLDAGPNVALRLTGVLVLLFTAYSLGSILLYGRSATLALRPEPQALMTLAAFREGGMLAGVVLAAIAPAVATALGAQGQGYGAFGWGLGLLALCVGAATVPMWRRPAIIGAAVSVKGLGDAGALRLLGLALANSLPVAMTSTLFLFFVQDKLMLPDAAGPLLMLFFISAGVSVPFWTRISGRIGPKRTLLIAMPLSIVGFGATAFLSAGDLWPFAAVCIAAGAALGADTVLLPAMFSVALTRARLNASLAFGIWAFAGKLGLALAAFLVMPVLEWNGFNPSQSNDAQALGALTAAYAIVPCCLKLIAWFLVARLPQDETAG